MARKHRTRRKRRQLKQFLKWGAKPRHTLIAGRTGSVHYKKTKPKQ
ncbi:MAG: hypothetical protein JNM13_16290 [Hyphomicrobiaceae bacterium]|nr:hypothetical protein [Hyphomicrobiaceae bacterium]